LALIAAVILFFWVKQHQNGKAGVTVSSATEAYTILRSGNKTLVYSRHARCRMDCRHIDESEVKEILQNGEVNFSKIEHSDKGETYPVEGKTHDGQNVRIVFAPHDSELVVVTVIDLGTEWKCDCE
jgi:hypothetical protein